MIELLGATAHLLFAICGAPEAYRAFKNGRSNVSLGFLSMWMIAELLALPYFYIKYGWDLWIMGNYLLNIIFIATILRYRLIPRG